MIQNLSKIDYKEALQKLHLRYNVGAAFSLYKKLCQKHFVRIYCVTAKWKYILEFIGNSAYILEYIYTTNTDFSNRYRHKSKSMLQLVRNYLDFMLWRNLWEKT